MQRCQCRFGAGAVVPWAQAVAVWAVVFALASVSPVADLCIAWLLSSSPAWHQSEWKEWEEPFALNDDEAFENFIGPTDEVLK